MRNRGSQTGIERTVSAFGAPEGARSPLSLVSGNLEVEYN